MADISEIELECPRHWHDADCVQSLTINKSPQPRPDPQPEQPIPLQGISSSAQKKPTAATLKLKDSQDSSIESRKKLVNTVSECKEIDQTFGRDGFDPYAHLKVPPPKPWNEWTLDADFEIGRPLGCGRFGHVYLARTKMTKRIVALKVMHVKDLMAADAQIPVNRETSIQASISHPNIVKMFGFFRDMDKIVLVLEYAPGGDVYSDLQAQPDKRYSEQKAATYADQITDAVQYLHGQGIMHRDLKLENLLIGYYGEIKVADFGWAAYDPGFQNSRVTFCGTYEYMAPEIVDGQPYDEKIDWWCIGIIIYEFLVGDTPFTGMNRIELQHKIRAGCYVIPRNISAGGRELIRQILCMNPEERITLEEIRAHPWVVQNKFQGPQQLLPCFDKFKKFEAPLFNRYKDAGRLLKEKRKIEKGRSTRNTM